MLEYMYPCTLKANWLIQWTHIMYSFIVFTNLSNPYLHSEIQTGPWSCMYKMATVDRWGGQLSWYPTFWHRLAYKTILVGYLFWVCSCIPILRASRFVVFEQFVKKLEAKKFAQATTNNYHAMQVKMYYTYTTSSTLAIRPCCVWILIILSEVEWACQFTAAG